MGALGPAELIIIGVVAVLLFGKNLPDVARKLGNSYEKFRKGLQDIKNEVNETVREDTTSSGGYSGGGYSGGGYSGDNGGASDSSSEYDQDDYEQPRAPRFQKPETQQPES